MPNAQLTWTQASLLGLGLVVLAALLARRAEWRLAALAPFSREAGVIAFLYALWQLAGTLAAHGSQGAFARARWIEHAQNVLGLPSERALQQPLLDHPWLGQAANIYYATMHFGALFALLLWVFWRHREHYAFVRTTVVAFTGLALLVQLIPVAPPRLLTEFGFSDVAAHYGQSVYSLGGGSVDQLSAMPSVHVGWAVLVGGVVVWLGSGPGRFVALLHTVATVYVVVATANHWWFDGLASIALLALVVALQLGWGRISVHTPRRDLELREPVRADQLTV
ncbi:MAG: inositol phosphorylceramide synthase [Pseudonocardiales bacterium]|nr:inositol phosphorylceramide synthase [Pseudonocardiales bacterium]